jgi:multicomponent Na+:H+ antiporter subunit B
MNPDRHLVLTSMAKLMIPLIIVFAIYVHSHGDIRPGGGFQAGAIVACALSLHLLVFGAEAARQLIPVPVLKIAAAFGVLLYAGTGLASVFFGKEYLDYDALGAGLDGQKFGILLIEIGVFLTVSATLTLCVYAFAGRVPDIRDEDR